MGQLGPGKNNVLSVNVYWVPIPDLVGIASSLFHKLGHWDLEVINKLYSFQAYLELSLFDFKAYILNFNTTVSG